MKDGFADLGLDLKDSDGISVGKGLDSLHNSEQERKILEARFGGTDNRYLPSSVMRAIKARVTEELDAPTAARTYDSTGAVSRGKVDKKLTRSSKVAKSFNVSGRGCGSGALSTFPQNIGRTMVLLYSEPGQVIFDPFAGHNSRMDLCVKEGRHYIGCDLSTEFMEFNKKRSLKLKEKYPNIKIKLHHGDSRKIPFPDEIADHTITSPPYFNIEYYGDEPEQLGKCKTYEDFLEGMQLVMNENFRCLKPGSYALWFINNFRQKGKMHFYHIDILRLGEKAGFITHDIVISDLGNGLRDCFLAQTVKTRIIPKRHEYGIVFRKPEAVPTKEKSRGRRKPLPPVPRG